MKKTGGMMKNGVLSVLAIIGCCLSFGVKAEPTIETLAKYAVVMEADTGRILFAKEGEAHMPTSSMSKVLTMYLVFEALEKGALKLDQTVKISSKAWQQKGSRMFLKEGQDVSVEDLIRGVIVQSGNDATVALAEAVAGSEASFAALMNEKATSLGMAQSHFVNASGLPDPEHYASARDLAVLAAALIRDFPRYYPYYSEKSFTFNGITQGNRNPLLYRDMGVDGVKTGHTEDAGFGLISSALRGTRRVIAVVNGLKNMQERADESAKLLEWAFAAYDTYTLVEKDAVAGDVPVWLGVEATVPVAAQDSVKMTLSSVEKEKVVIEKFFDPEVEAPVAKGRVLGKLVVKTGEEPAIDVPLIAVKDIERLGVFKASWLRLRRMLGR